MAKRPKTKKTKAPQRHPLLPKGVKVVPAPTDAALIRWIAEPEMTGSGGANTVHGTVATR